MRDEFGLRLVAAGTATAMQRRIYRSFRCLSSTKRRVWESMDMWPQAPHECLAQAVVCWRVNRSAIAVVIMNLCVV